MTTPINSNCSINEYDLLKITQDTNLHGVVHGHDYGLIQLVKLRLTNPNDYHSIPHWGVGRENETRLFHQTFTSIRLDIPAPSGLEIKIHNVKDPTRAKICLRNPELLIAHILGLGLNNKAEAKIIKSIAILVNKKFQIDLTKLDKSKIAIIPDPKSKRKEGDGLGVMFGENPTESEIVTGTVFLTNQTGINGLAHEFNGSHLYYAPRGICLAVVGESIETPDERMPEYSMRRVKFLVTQGLSKDRFETATYFAHFPTGSTNAVRWLIKVETTDLTTTPTTEEETAANTP